MWVCTVAQWLTFSPHSDWLESQVDPLCVEFESCPPSMRGFSPGILASHSRKNMLLRLIGICKLSLGVHGSIWPCSKLVNCSGGTLASPNINLVGSSSHVIPKKDTASYEDGWMEVCASHQHEATGCHAPVSKMSYLYFPYSQKNAVLAKLFRSLTSQTLLMLRFQQRTKVLLSF